MVWYSMQVYFHLAQHSQCRLWIHRDQDMGAVIKARENVTSNRLIFVSRELLSVCLCIRLYRPPYGTFKRTAYELLCFSGSALLEDDKVFHLVRPAEELDEVKSKRGSMKDKAPIKTITEIYLTRLLSMKVKIKQCDLVG